MYTGLEMSNGFNFEFNYYRNNQIVIIVHITNLYIQLS